LIKLKELRDNMIRELTSRYPEKESENIVLFLLSAVAAIEKKDILLHPDKMVSEVMEAEFRIKLDELLDYKPVQYVTGKAYFYGIELDVNPSVLIPRPETEELVKWVIDDYQGIKGISILDIGTGSGCIPVALGSLLINVNRAAIDISSAAIAVAARNAERYNVPVDFLTIDILDENQWERLGKFDVVISNPPYVRESEKRTMRPNVLNHEPGQALFVPDDDPLVFYRAIENFARLKLNPRGRCYVEINESLGTASEKVFRNAGFKEVNLHKDMQNKDRMIRACV
jgi:release factor glutamine methyltransferase